MTNRNNSIIPFGTHFPTNYRTDDIFTAIDQLAQEMITPRFRPRLKEIFQTNSKFPSLEVARDPSKENLILKLSVAGYSKEDISIEFDPERQSIVVSGEKSTSEGQNDEELFYSEIKKSSFQRRIPVSEKNIKNLDNIKSSMADGILTITIPYEFEDVKIEASKRKIAIE